MKKFHLYIIVVLAYMMLVASACKKQDVDLTAEYKLQTDDQLMISAEIDGVTIDASNAVESSDYFFARTQNVNSSICDGIVTVDSTSAFKYITINYSGVNCSGRMRREGQVMISMQKNIKWSDAGAVLNISYIGLKITRLSDNKSLSLNGDVILTNESGGRLASVGSADIVHLINSSHMNITFDDGTQRSWQLAVKRRFSYDNGLVITSTGNRNEASKTGISAWGSTRTGRPFITIIEEPMIIRQDCYFRLVSAKLIQEQNQTLAIKFGLNEEGEPASCPPGNYYLQVSWNGIENARQSFLLAY